ncbi:hypothetical protein G9A89_020585 [Geosiphon pyriformis]|nr:hypothetical protein G9A89_020585 [Geosiphon pyriformis]
METNAHDIWDYVVLVGGKTCIIDCYLVSYAWTKCTTVCFDSAESLDAIIKTTPVLREANLHWSYLVSAKCAGCRKLGHTLLACSVNEKKYVSSGASLWKTLSNLDKSRLAAIYIKCLVPVAHSVSFGGSSFSSPSGQNILLKAGFFLEIKPTLLVSLELNDRFATLEHSLTSLAECVDILAKRLDTLEPMVFQLSPGHQPLVTLSLQNQGADIVMSESLGVATGGKTIVEVVVFDSTVILKMEETLNNLSITVMSLSAKINNAGLDDIICWHKKKNNLVSIFMKSKLKEKICSWIVNKFNGIQVFTSGLESGYLDAGVVIVMDSFLVRHVCKILEVPGQILSIKLLFKNKLSVSILGLYTGVSSVAWFSQAGNINSLIAKTVNESSFVIIRDNFNENSSRKYASFKKCLNFGLVNALGVVKIIDYVLISSNLVNVVMGCGVFGIKKYFDTNYQTVSVLAKFKNNMAANAAMFYDDFFVAGMCSDLNAMWFKDYDCIFVKESSKFYKLELLVLKLVKAFCLDFFGEFMSLLDKWESLDLVNASVVKSLFLLGSPFDTIWSVLFKKWNVLGNLVLVTLNHLVMNNKLVLELNLVRTKVDVIMEEWTRKHNVSLEYVFDNAFSGVMCSIDFNKMSDVISNLPNKKVAGFFGISNKLWKHCDRPVLDMLLVLLNLCLDLLMISKLYKWKDVFTNTCSIALIETAHKILSKIFLNRIFFAYSKFNVLRGNNFFVLKSTTTQSSIFAIESLVLQNMRKAYDSVGWKHLRKSLVKIKMCDKFIQFFGGIHNGQVNKVMTDFGLTNEYQIHDGLDQGEVFSLFLWHIFYDPLLCKVKRQESICGYRLDSCFITKTGYFESWADLTSFFAVGAFIDDTIWIGNSQAATQHILNIASKFFRINDISINNDKTVAILINCRSLSKPSLAKAHLDAVSNKQFSYLVSVFSFVSTNVYVKWDTMICKSLKSKSGLPLNFPNNTIYYSSLYGLKSFKQVQAEDKSAFVVSFANSVGILGCLFAHRSHNLQVLSWCLCHSLLFPSHINVNPSDNFLAGVVWIFLGCDLSLDGLVTNAFHFQNGTPMSVILNKPTFHKCVSLLWHYGIAFVKQLCSHMISYWFNVSVCFLNGFGPSFVCNLLLPDVGLSNVLESHKFEVVYSHLLRVNSGHLSLFMNGFLSGLGTPGMKAGAAVFFEDINLSLDVEVSGLVSSTMAKLQAIALAFDCVSFSRSINLFLDSQAALDVCKSKFMLIHPDFRNQCWIEYYHIANVICHINLVVNWVKVKGHSGVLDNEHANAFTGAAVLSDMHLPHMIDKHFFRTGGIAVSGNFRHFVYSVFQSVYCVHWKVGSGFWVLVDSLCANVNWFRSSLVWHPDFYLAALYYHLLVAVCKCLYNRSYLRVICLFCGNVEVSDHVFFCLFNAAGHVRLVEVHASAWETCLVLSCSSLYVLQLLSTCVSNVGVGTALYKGFVFKEWYCEFNIVVFMHEFCLVFHNDVWLICAKHQAVMEKDGIILHDGSVLVSISGSSSVLSAGMVT